MSRATRLTVNDFNSLEDWMKYSSSQKNHGRFHYEAKIAHKANERIRTASFQKVADRYKKHSKLLSHKKVKGEVMPTAMALNNRCAKGWAQYGGFKESFKTFCVWDIT